MYETITALLPNVRAVTNANANPWIVQPAIEEATLEFAELHPESNLNNYQQTLRDAGIPWNKTIADVDVAAMDGALVLAILYGAVRAERMWGALGSFLKNGAVLRWLERLQAIDAES